MVELCKRCKKEFETNHKYNDCSYEKDIIKLKEKNLEVVCRSECEFCGVDKYKLNIAWKKFNVKNDLRYEYNKEQFLELVLRSWKLLNMELITHYRGNYIPVTIENDTFSITGNPPILLNKLNLYESFIELVEKEGDQLIGIKDLTYRNEFIFTIQLWDGSSDEILEFNRAKYNNFIKLRQEFYKLLNIDTNSLISKYPINWNKMKICRGARCEDGKRAFLVLVMRAWDLLGLELISDYKGNSIPLVLKNDRFAIKGTSASILKKFNSYEKFLEKLKEEGDQLIDVIELSTKTEMIYRIKTYDSKGEDYVQISSSAYYKLISVRQKFYKVLNDNGHMAKTNYIGSEENIEIDYGCEHENEITNPRNYLNSPRCKYCAGIKVIRGKTDIATTHPHIVKYFCNKEDSTKYSFGSEVKVEFNCLDCGTIEKRKIASVMQKGLRCKRCDDNISFGQKVMNNLLYQLKEQGILEDFDTEYSPSWTDRPYDNSFNYNGEIFIVENNGNQHYEESSRGRSLKEEQDNDTSKYGLALKNDILEENYIVIDARKSEIEYIKKSILESRLSQIFDLNKIDWQDCYEKSLKSLVKVVCDLYSKDALNVPMISEKLKLGKTTVRRYLRRGELLGWCSYDPKNDRLKNQICASESRKESVVCLNTGEQFDSIKDAAAAFKINPASISAVCRGKSYFGGRDEAKKIYYVWAKIDNYLKMSEDEIKKRIEKACKIGERM
jgi:hypothetical protein